MTVKGMIAEMKGQQALWSVDTLRVLVDIRDIREAFGRVDFLISPVGGSGEKWVQKGSLNFTVGTGADITGGGK